MAKYDLKFIDRFNEKTIKVEKVTKELYTRNEDVINIYVDDNDLGMCISLDKSTAIKFAKTLRTEINKINTDTNE